MQTVFLKAHGLYGDSEYFSIEFQMANRSGYRNDCVNTQVISSELLMDYVPEKHKSSTW